MGFRILAYIVVCYIKCAQVVPAFDPVNDIHDSQGSMAGGVVSGIMPNLPDNSSSNRRREQPTSKAWMRQHPLRTPAIKRGDVPLLITPMLG